MDSTEKDYSKKSIKHDARSISKKCNKGNNDGAVESTSRRQNTSQQSNGHHHNGFKPPIIKPRISKLENLEAKMASIEVSLSSNNSSDSQLPFTCKRAVQSNCLFHNSNHRHQCNGIYFSTNNIGNIAKTETSNQLSTSAKLSSSAMDITYLTEEIDSLRDRLNEKDAIICSLRGQTNHIVKSQTTVSNQYMNLNNTWTHDSSPKENHTKEDRAELIQRQIENKSVIIKNLKIKLDSLEVKDLDSRIRQAELECLLEKEEMKILNLKEEFMNSKSINQKAIEAGNRHQPSQTNNEELTLYSIVFNSNCSTAVAFEISYDNSAPCFYATSPQVGSGLIVNWTKENSKLRKGDRVLEVNGQSVLNCSKDNFIDMLKSTITMPLKMVVLRSTYGHPTRKSSSKEMDVMKEEMSSLVNKLDNKIKENRELLISMQQLQKETGRLKNDNQRLHHRTLYLEDHVNELARNHQAKAKTSITNFPDDAAGNSVEACVPSNAPVTTNSTLSFITNVQQTTVNRSLQCTNALLKSERSNVVQVCSRSNSSAERHVLQVKIPFSNSSNHERVGHNSCRPYMNVPIGHRLLPVQNCSKDKASSNTEQWIHGRWAGADSDSGNYSGDSMDDSQQGTVPHIMTGFILQRQVPQQHVTVTAISADDDIKVRSHCYMNVQPNRELPTPLKDTENKTKSPKVQIGCAIENKSIKSHQIIHNKRPGKLNANSIRLLTDDLHTLNDGEVEIEEWC
ncbi:hypothetical protein CHUAL_004550 [Chamberlinius hualienensis]